MASAVRGRIRAPAAPFTQEQERAVRTRAASVALSAGAGCGKTFVLTERFLSHLEPGDPEAPPCDLSQLIAITFTERAAREMRDRIRAKCFERLARSSPQHSEYWLQLLRSLDSARVSTIHSFCASLLRTHAVEAEADPRFAILEAAQADTLLSELIDDVLRSRLAARDETILDLVAVFGLPRLRDAIASLLESARGRDYQSWLAKSPEDVVAVWAELHHREAIPTLLRQLASSPAATELLRIVKEHDCSHAKIRERCAALLAKLPTVADSTDPEADLSQIRECAKVIGTKKGDWPDETVYERFKTAAEALRKRIDNLLKVLKFDPLAARSSAEIGLALLAIVAQVDGEYERVKSDRAFLDFDDLLLRARRLLTDPNHKRLRERIAERTKLLLVDECQDTDPVQVELIKSLCGDDYQAGKLFFVGDFKQSIYRFRGADPTVFRTLEAEMPKRGRLPLSCNFRSQPAILHFVNALFCDAFPPRDDDDAESRYEPLTAHRKQDHPGPAIEFMWCAGDKISSDDEGPEHAAEPQNAETLRRREADWIARRICQLVGGETPDGQPVLAIRDNSSTDPRPVRKGDIAILLRSLSDVAYYEEALRNYDIDYYLVGGHAFYAQQEIYDVLNLLRALASPADEVSLAGVLRSPFFSLTDETLFWLAQQGLWAGLSAKQLPSQIQDSQRQAAAFAAKVLLDLRAKKDRLPIAALLNDALHQTSYDAALLCEFLGERKLANLRKLIGQARSFDRAGVLGLSDFIVQLSQFVVRQPRESLAATQPEATDVVRLMTIHQAKGLEFPVVIVPDLARAPHGHTDSAEFSTELGPLVRLPSEHEHCDAVNGHRLHQIFTADEEHDEIIRLLYVATTRAADFLILSSSMKSLERAGGPWMELLGGRFDLSTGRLTASLPAGYVKPQVRVIMSPPSTDAARRPKHSSVDLERLADEIEHAVEVQVADHPCCADVVPCDQAARRRFSVSRLHGALEIAPPEHPATDDGFQTLPANAAIDLGTLVHVTLANLDFREPPDLASHVLLHADKLGLRQQPQRDEALQMLKRFLDSPRARALRDARQVYSEVEFLLAWPPSSAAANANRAGRYLQGYLDCLYQDSAGSWHVVDYKTNQVSAGNLAALVETYQLQMLAYGLAAEHALGEPVAGLTLHFLRTGAEHTFPWDDKTRQRAIELIGGAIESLCRPLLSSPRGEVG
jgi:ATP-dependent helicase/nuclease subunit A